MSLKLEKDPLPIKYLVIGIVTITLLTTAYSLYKPLPDGFTVSKWDRAVMHIVEPALRVAYYYPVCSWLHKLHALYTFW